VPRSKGANFDCDEAATESDEVNYKRFFAMGFWKIISSRRNDRGKPVGDRDVGGLRSFYVGRSAPAGFEAKHYRSTPMSPQSIRAFSPDLII
jgi:hypothetical protein